jgi:hypothetical protein
VPPRAGRLLLPYRGPIAQKPLTRDDPRLFDIITPAFGGHKVRTIDVDGTRWFAATEVLAPSGIQTNAVRAYLAQQGVKDDELRIYLVYYEAKVRGRRLCS